MKSVNVIIALLSLFRVRKEYYFSGDPLFKSNANDCATIVAGIVS